MAGIKVGGRGRRILVAGGAGFIGSNLCRELVADGNEVICLDNLITGRRVNLDSLLGHPRFTFIEHDVIEPLPSLDPVDQIYHLASPASPPGYKLAQMATLQVNSEGTRRLLELAGASGATFLYASTSEAYGDPLEHPQKETYRGNVSSTGPRSMYDEAKRFGEAMSMAAFRTMSIDARIVRIFNTYGPNSDPLDGRLIPNVICQALNNQPVTVYAPGSQTRSLCFVSDLVRGLRMAMAEPRTTGQVLNLGNPEEHSVLEFARLVISLTNSSSNIIFTEPAVGDDPQRRCPDITRAQALLGWRPEVTLPDGLATTIEYFRAALAADCPTARPQVVPVSG